LKVQSNISYISNSQVKQAALELAKAMEKEDGIQGAVNAFHKHIHYHLQDHFAELPLAELSHQHRSHGILFRIKRKCKSIIHH
jgi:sterol 3beta-glucosyltransferase